MALDEYERVDNIRRSLEAVELARLIACGQAQNGMEILGRIERGVRRRQKLSALLASEEQRQVELIGLARIRRTERIARRMSRAKG